MFLIAKILCGLRFAGPLALLALLAGCQFTNCGGTQCGTSTSDEPGSFSYYAQISFNPNGSNNSFCFNNDSSCTYDVRDNFAAPLQQAGWTLNNGVTSAVLNGAWTGPDVTADDINNEHPSMLYVFSHGGMAGGTDPQICLYNCDGSTWGGDYSWGSQTLPAQWNGPNWLILDVCDVVQQTTAWDSIFGGSLHGILGWNANTHEGLSEPGDAGYQTFDKLIEGYDTAVDAWEQSARVTDSPSMMAMLIPAQNSGDAIEAAGGPHFGYNGDTNPEYYFIQSDGTVGVVSPMALSAEPSQAYSLIGEQMNESYWYNYYGGGGVSSAITHPSSNEDLYRNPYVTVTHYLASGGIVVNAGRTGTAKGFSAGDALQYALNWIQDNGGLPSDAVLTYAGDEVVQPNSVQPTSDQPYPNRTSYVFTWRHANSGILSNDKITVAVDDAGHLTTYNMRTYNVRCGCWYERAYQAPPWVPVYHVSTYARVWRTLGAPTQTINPTITGSSYAYCASDMAAPVSEAVPCAVSGTSSGRTYRSLATGAVISLGSY